MTTSVLPFPSILPSSSVDVLRTRRTGPTSSGFRNVYYVGTDEYGSPVYKARVKRAGVLRHLEGSRSSLPHVCALYVVRWYEDTFGPAWREVLEWRKKAAFDVWHSPHWGGFLARAWVQGSPEEIPVLKKRRGGGDWWRPTDEPAVFATRKDALRGARLYLRRRYGLLAEVLVWRKTRGAA